MTMADVRSPLATIQLDRLTPLPDGRVVEWEARADGVEPLVWVEGGPGLPAHLARADVVPVLDRFRCHLVNAPGSGRSAPLAVRHLRVGWPATTRARRRLHLESDVIHLPAREGS